MAQKRKHKADVLTSIPAEYYAATTSGRAYHVLADTAATDPVIPPIDFEKGDVLLATNKLGEKWLQVAVSGVRYFVRTQSMELSPTGGLRAGSNSPPDPTSVTSPSTPPSNGSSSSSHFIQTGPRGGRYYINGNGNKTYVKHK
jgi:hypothetical protein